MRFAASTVVAATRSSLRLQIIMLRVVAASALLLLAKLAPASAHPHIFVDAKAELLFNGKILTAIRHVWRFDGAFSAFAVQGMDTNYDGKLSPEELAPLATLNVKSLAGYGYYTYVIVDQKNVELAQPSDYHLDWDNSRLTLTFTLPLRDPSDVKTTAAVEVFDVEYYTSFTFPPADPFALAGAAPSCIGTFMRPQPLDETTFAAVSAIPANQRIVPPELRQAVSKLANIISVSCS